MYYKNNNLTIYDEMELEDAGLDVNELAQMDWCDRFDAIDEAGLNPMDYDYGFLNDEYMEEDETVSREKIKMPKCKKVSRIRTPKVQEKKTCKRKPTRKEIKRERKERERREMEAFEDMIMYIEAWY